MIKRGLTWIKDLLFPVFCISCGKEGEWWCQECAHTHIRVKTFTDGNLTSVTALFTYQENEPIGKLIKQFKYHHAHDMVSMWKHVLQLPLEAVNGATIIPVPLYARRERERGYNQAYLLGREIAHTYNLPLSRKLRRIKPTEQQVTLSREKRLTNMHGVFAWMDSRPAPKKIVLVDDVYTTGATMNNCAEVLFANGADEVHGFVLAHG